MPPILMTPEAEPVSAGVVSAVPVSAGAGVLLVPPPQPARTPMSMAPARDRDSHFFMFFM